MTPGGLLRVDLGRAKAEENLDGKYLLRSADPQMTRALHGEPPPRDTARG